MLMDQSLRIIIIDPPHPFLLQRFDDWGWEYVDATQLDKAAVAAQIHAFDGMLIRSRFKVDADFMAKGTQLQFIARYGVGLEHIDLKAAAQRGIPVFNSPEGSRDAVGEHTIGLLLMLMNHLSRADREVRAGDWIREGNRGTEIKGKTVGIMGYGNMGKAFAQRLQGFECEILAYDRFKSGFEDQLVKEVDLPTIFEQCDIVSLHFPYMPENHHYVNNAFLSQFQKPIYVVNTARGLILNTADLVSHLEKGSVAGAALDVVEYEEMSFRDLSLDDLPAPFQYLRQAKNVVLAPHIAGWSHEAKLGHAQVLARKIEALVKRNKS